MKHKNKHEEMQHIMRELEEKAKRKAELDQQKIYDKMDVMNRQLKVNEIEAKKRMIEDNIKNRRKNDIELQIEGNKRYKEMRKQEERERDVELMREYDRIQQEQEDRRHIVIKYNK